MTKLTIITINYNDAEGLARTIASVSGQSSSEFEYIVIDGGSDDESVNVIQKNASRIGQWVSEKDTGIFNAQNKGAQKSSGNYLLFLNSGDVLADKNVVADILPRLRSYDLVYGDLLVDHSGTEERVEMPEVLDVYHFMISTLAHPCTFISSALFKKLGGLREELKITADYEFFLRAVLVEHATYTHVPRIISIFNSEGVSSDPANEEKQLAERKKSWEMNFPKPAIEAFENYTRLMRSSELKMGKFIKNFIKPFRSK